MFLNKLIILLKSTWIVVLQSKYFIGTSRTVLSDCMQLGPMQTVNVTLIAETDDSCSAVITSIKLSGHFLVWTTKQMRCTWGVWKQSTLSSAGLMKNKIKYWSKRLVLVCGRCYKFTTTIILLSSSQPQPDILAKPLSRRRVCVCVCCLLYTSRCV